MTIEREINSMYTETEQSIIDQALDIVASKLQREPYHFTSSAAAKTYLQIKYGNHEHEVFVALMLDNQHQLIAVEELFRGTIDGAAVYPREVVKSVLQHNAAALILAHNHPSGNGEPSQADIAITQRLASALALIEVRVLDHFVVTATNVVSLMERDLL